MADALNHEWHDLPGKGGNVTACKKCFVLQTSPDGSLPCVELPITEAASRAMPPVLQMAIPQPKASDYFKNLTVDDLDRQIAEHEGELEALRILRDAVKARDERKKP